MAAATTAAVAFGASALASADSPAAPSATSDEMPLLVEDFNYPGADRVLKTEGIKLKRGDGHITLAECGRTTGQIIAMTVADGSVGRKGEYCFEVNAKSGYLTLELPRIFAFEAGGQAIKASLTAEGQTETVAIPKDGYKSVGEGLPGGSQSVLVEIRVTG
ncbi:hypothetical protein [Streptomyces sp. NPDC046939]|uniref:hypothetical protein n=1 Tax=Streptomyces sp. NPDC046939 TaxID=3155376 RepID=UPI003400D01E